MDFSELVRARYSVRKFRAQPLKEEQLNAILAAGRAAPTACNLQPQRIFVLRGEEALSRVRGCTKYSFGAPCVLLVCTDTEHCYVRKYDGRPSAEIDAAIVTTHMMLAAYALGVGSTWVMSFDPARIREQFSLPAAWQPVALLPLGYPAEDAQPAPYHAERMPLDQTVFEFCPKEE